MTLPVHLVGAGSLAGVAVGGIVELDGDEGRHAVAVRRMRVGEPLDLVDGAGTRARARVAELQPPSRLLAVVESVAAEPPPTPSLVVVQALAKGDRSETAVETLTEVGVDEIVPWQAARSVARWNGAKAESGAMRWRRTAQESGKQARRAWLPVVAPLADTPEVVRRVSAAALALVLDETAREPLGSTQLPRQGEIVVVVGPEGGLTPEEVEALVSAGARPVVLGPSVLRTSTAGTVAAGVILSRSARWSGPVGSQA